MKNIDMPTTNGCPAGSQNILATYKPPAINNEQKPGGQSVLKYTFQDALVIFLDNEYQIINMLTILKITPKAAPEIPAYIIKG